MNNDIRDVFNRFRKALNESEEQEKQNGVPYTQQDELLQSSMQSAINAFGASFSNIKTPMFYYKEDGDITLSGEIPSLSDAKFQFSYKNGCNLWSNNGQIKFDMDEKITTINRMYGNYKNWKDEINHMTDKKPMSMNNNDN
jgi:hypothetical protein